MPPPFCLIPFNFPVNVYPFINVVYKIFFDYTDYIIFRNGHFKKLLEIEMIFLSVS